jgi:hypothetical protein
MSPFTDEDDYRGPKEVQPTAKVLLGASFRDLFGRRAIFSRPAPDEIKVRDLIQSQPAFRKGKVGAMNGPCRDEVGEHALQPVEVLLCRFVSQFS